jgi:hypothetical protein
LSHALSVLRSKSRWQLYLEGALEQMWVTVAQADRTIVDRQCRLADFLLP